MKAEPGTDWRRLRGMTDAAVHAAVIADPEINPTDEAFWKAARVIMPQPKKTVTKRLDADLLAWFRQRRGYQTRINAILRAYMTRIPRTDRPRELQTALPENSLSPSGERVGVRGRMGYVLAR